MGIALLTPPVAAKSIPVTPEMLKAGRTAFAKGRRQLGDLFECFDCDRDAFLRAIYRAMARVERSDQLRT